MHINHFNSTVGIVLSAIMNGASGRSFNVRLRLPVVSCNLDLAEMEACVLVEREQDKITKKLRLLSGSSAKKLQNLLEQVAMVKAKFEEGLWSFCFGSY